MIAPATVEVGREYPVSCILDAGRWIPVFPVPHTDNEPEFFVNVPEHFHVDNRFIDNDPGTVFASKGQPMEVRPVTCLRETHRPPDKIIWLHLALLKHFEGHRLKNCLVCPHKGMPIINGVCAGHGLKWNAQGYLEHRGPFSLRWGENIGEVRSLEIVEIPITHAHSGPLVLEVLDAENRVAFTHTEHQYIDAWVGDRLKVNNRNIEMIRR